jgi:hypothetical protein
MMAWGFILEGSKKALAAMIVVTNLALPESAWASWKDLLPGSGRQTYRFTGEFDPAEGGLCSTSTHEMASELRFAGDSYQVTVAHMDSTCKHVKYYLVSSGTYRATGKAIEFTQSWLELIPAPGQSGRIACTGVTLIDGEPESVAGRECDGQRFRANDTSKTVYGKISATELTLPLVWNIALPEDEGLDDAKTEDGEPLPQVTYKERP